MPQNHFTCGREAVGFVSGVLAVVDGVLGTVRRIPHDTPPWRCFRSACKSVMLSQPKSSRAVGLVARADRESLPGHGTFAQWQQTQHTSRGRSPLTHREVLLASTATHGVDGVVQHRCCKAPSCYLHGCPNDPGAGRSSVAAAQTDEASQAGHAQDA